MPFALRFVRAALEGTGRLSAHAVIEAVQDERTSGVGAFETPGAGTAGGCGGRDSN